LNITGLNCETRQKEIWYERQKETEKRIK
jgi:hypothetical protein